MHWVTHKGMFVYKMYGEFDNISANEFLRVQLDLTEFRLSWDSNTSQCSILEQELREEEHCLSQIYYWEVEWPRFFANRDYVCNRRTQIDLRDNVAVSYSKSAKHPKAPTKTKNFRVADYWSAMTVKPTTDDWDKPGVEFCLTAYENPGVSLPNYITTWVAMRGMPEFMANLRKACLELRQQDDESNKVQDNVNLIKPVPTANSNDNSTRQKLSM